MKKKRSKQSITIEVDPLAAMVTIGLVRGIFPSIIAQLEEASKGGPVGDGLKFTNVKEMQEVLDEIYQKCIERTDVREKVKEFMKEAGWDMDDE